MPKTYRLSWAVVATALVLGCSATQSPESPLLDEDEASGDGASAIADGGDGELASPTSTEAPYSDIPWNLHSTLYNLGQTTCMDIPWGNPNPGEPANQYPCHGGPAQQFYLAQRPTGAVIRNANTGMCIMPDAATGSGYTLAQQPCDPTDTTQEFFPYVYIKGFQPPYDNTMVLYWADDPSLCVEAVPGIKQLELRPCTSSNDQSWYMSFPNLTHPCSGHCGEFALVGCVCDDRCMDSPGSCCPNWEESCNSEPPPPPEGEDCEEGEQCCGSAVGGGCWMCWPEDQPCP